MSLYHSAIKYDPEWDLPADEEFDKTSVEGKFLKRVDRFHLGLMSVSVIPYYRNESGADMRCKIQRFIVVKGGKNKKPAISSDELARTIVCWGDFFAEDLGGKVPGLREVRYEVIFYGENDSGAFQNRGSFRSQVPEHEPPKAGEEQPQEAASEPDQEPPSDPSLGSRVRRIDLGVPVPRSALENEAVVMMGQTADMIKTTLGQLTSNLDQLRISFSGALGSIDHAWKSVLEKSNMTIDRLITENEHCRDEITRANSRLIKMSEVHSAQNIGEKKIIESAMNFFLEAMKSQWGSLNREMSWERQIMYQQFDNLAEKYKKENRYELLKEFSPLLLAVGGQILERMGSGAGSAMQAIAASSGPTPPDEPPPPARRPAPQAPRRTIVGVPQIDAEARFKDHPVASMLNLFGTQIANQQEKLKEVLGDKYDLLDAAIKAQDDAEARRLGSKFMSSIVPLKAQFETVLNKESKELFRDIHTKIFGTPGRAETISTASLAELRTIAKEKHGLTFDKNATKEQILEAIQKAS